MKASKHCLLSEADQKRASPLGPSEISPASERGFVNYMSKATISILFSDLHVIIRDQTVAEYHEYFKVECTVVAAYTEREYSQSSALPLLAVTGVHSPNQGDTAHLSVARASCNPRCLARGLYRRCCTAHEEGTLCGKLFGRQS